MGYHSFQIVYSQWKSRDHCFCFIFCITFFETSLITTVAFPVLVAVMERGRATFPLFIAAACAASALSLFGHRGNIQRLVKGEENKLDFAKISDISKKVMSKVKKN